MQFLNHLVLISLINYGISSEVPPRIIIIGSGASGIAAATKLLQNGFTDIIILEAENRIGGRLHSSTMGEYVIDLGAEWVHGEENNVAFDLAWPLGLLQRSSDVKEFEWTVRIFGSSGNEIPHEIASSFSTDAEASVESLSAEDLDNLKTGSVGEFAEKKLNEYFNNHSEISSDLHKPLSHYLNMVMMINEAGNHWNELSAKGYVDYEGSPGDQMNNWKERSYTTILDILMKSYPNPEEELPVKNITKLNSKVSEIKLNENDVKVTTTDGEEYTGGHVIVTASLGVLQKNYHKLFSPPLPEKKINAIKNLSLGHVAKIILYYENPWWLNDPVYGRGIYWTEEDRNKIENDLQQRWMLGISLSARIEHRPKLLLFWLSGPHVAEMESIPEEIFQNQVKELVKKFYGKSYNITDEPKIIKRTLWNTNENFLGTYSYRGVQVDAAEAHIEDYEEPIMKNNKPVLQFAGEGTSHQHSSVHGAIKSGWREADRLINYYSKKN